MITDFPKIVIDPGEVLFSYQASLLDSNCGNKIYEHSALQLYPVPTSFPSLIDCHRVVDSQGTSHYCRLAKFVSQLISLCSRASLVLLIEQKFYHSSHLSCIKLVLCALSIVSGGKQAPRLLDYPLYSGHLS